MILPVLNFHGVEARQGEYAWTEGEAVYVITKTLFADYLDYLQKGAWECALSDQLEPGSSRASRRVILTVDDGHASSYEHIYPLLRLRGMRAVFFVSAGLLDQPGYLSSTQLKEMAQAGMEIGSHGYQHVPLTDLPRERIWNEIAGSKTKIEAVLQRPVTSFSVPRGFYTPLISRIAFEAGYRYLYTSRFGLNQPLRLDQMDRLAVKRHHRLEDLQAWTEGRMGSTLWREQMKAFLRAVMPAKAYDWAAKLKRTPAC